MRILNAIFAFVGMIVMGIGCIVGTFLFAPGIIVPAIALVVGAICCVAPIGLMVLGAMGLINMGRGGQLQADDYDYNTSSDGGYSYDNYDSYDDEFSNSGGGIFGAIGGMIQSVLQAFGFGNKTNWDDDDYYNY